MSDYTDDVIEEESPTAKPEGTPALWPMLKLPRRKKSGVIRQLKTLAHAQETLSLDDLKKVGEDGKERELTQDEQLDLAAAASDLWADFEDLLRSVAVDGDEFEAWVCDATDEALAELSGWYMKTMQLGEAPASTDS